MGGLSYPPLREHVCNSSQLKKGDELLKNAVKKLLHLLLLSTSQKLKCLS